MRTNPKDFKYFKFTPEKSKQLLDEFEVISKQRKTIVNECLESLGASGHQMYDGKIQRVAWDKSYKFDTPAIIKNEADGYIFARGNNRYKEGKAFNEKKACAIDSANDRLEKLPTFRFFIINKLGLVDRWISLPGVICRPSFFVSKEIIYAEIPCKCFEAHKTENGWSMDDGDAYVIPADSGMEEITYGQYYDETEQP